jgi:hypothetical protein
MKKLIIQPKENPRERPYVEVSREAHRWLAEVAVRTGRTRKEIIDAVFSYAREHMEIAD